MSTLKTLSTPLLFLSVLFVTTLAADYVPVYIWETKKSAETVPALDRISEESFKDLLLERLSDDPFVVIFAENNLSPEDFAQRSHNGKTVFPELSKFKEAGKVTYWPFVRNPLLAVRQLEKPVTEVNGESYVKNPFDVADDGILVVDLKDAREDEERVDMLKRHDENVAKIYEILQKRYKNVIAVYTARHSSWVVPEETRSHRRYRSLLADGDNADNRKLFKSNNSMVFFNNTAVYYNGDSKRVVLNDLEASYATDTTTNRTIMTLSDSTKSTSFNFIFQFNVSTGYYHLENIEVSDNNKQYTLKVANAETQIGWSYHCYPFRAYGNDTTQNLTIDGFQFQASLTGLTSNSFAEAYDCVGFMTATIWSGIFVTFILALIMTFGLTMMMDIKTMDRFDDPKGKTITINTSE